MEEPLSQSLKEQAALIKSQHDLRYVFPASSKRKRLGTGVMDCCVFHDDRTPSLLINADRFHCFGCGASGDFFDFTKRTRQWNWLRTVRDHLELPVHPFDLVPYTAGEEEVKAAVEFPAGMALAPHFACNQHVIDYFLAKGLTRPTILRFKLGFGISPQNPLPDDEVPFAQRAFTIPLFDDGKLCGMKFRRNDCCPHCWSPRSQLDSIDELDVTLARCPDCDHSWFIDGPKYTSLSGQRRILWGYRDIPEDYTDTVFIVEGEFDRMVMWQHGFHCVTSTAGNASFTAVMANKLKRFRRVIALVDQDPAGQEGARMMQAKLTDLQIFPAWREGKDVSDVANVVGDLQAWIKKQDRFRS